MSRGKTSHALPLEDALHLGPAASAPIYHLVLIEAGRRHCLDHVRKLEAICEVDEDLMLRTENIATQCSFCGGSHEWVFVGSTQPGLTPKDQSLHRRETSRPR
jgi:hypothetical protein